MGLPWIREDSDLASQAKMLNLLSDPSSKRWQAAFSTTCAKGWSALNETDGVIPRVALPWIHATTATARLLVTYGLWEEHRDGWLIVAYAEKQQLSMVSQAKNEATRRASEKANCHRWHEKGGKVCWVDGRCTHVPE